MHRDTATNQHAHNASSPFTSPPSSARGLFSPARRPPPLTTSAMGQAESSLTNSEQQQHQLPPPPSPQPTSKLRFGWPGRRKKSEDLTKIMGAPTVASTPSPLAAPPPPPSAMGNTTRGRELSRTETNVSSVDSHSGLHLHDLSRPPSRTSSAKQLTFQFASNTLTALKGKLNASQASIHSLRTAATSPTTPPPPLPPKPDLSRLSSATSSHSESSSGDWVALDRSSKPLPPFSTTDMSAPVTQAEAQQEMVPTVTEASVASVGHDVNVPLRRERERREDADTQTAKDIADDWRKSDSTLRTVRLVGSRTPRPLSLAESTNSGHTVLPSVGAGSPAGNMNMGAGKRLSALMTDADFGLPEVDSEEDEDDEDELPFASAPPSAFNNSAHSLQQYQQQQQRQQSPGHSSSRSSSPASAPGCQPQTAPRRGSLSIRIGRLSGSKARTSEHGHMSGSESEALSSSVSTRDTGMGVLTANSSTTSVSSSSPGASTKDSRPSIEIASSASIASSMSSEQRPHQYAQYKANSKLDPWIALSSNNNTASQSQASLSTSESVSTGSVTGSINQNADAQKGGHPPVSLNTSNGSTLRPAHQRTRLQSIQARGFRQTAVSLSAGLAPAAGFARKAVDKLGRALGGSSSSLSNSDAHEMPAGACSSSSHTSSASTPNVHGQSQHGQHHRQHGHGHLPAQHPPSSAKKAMRRHGASPSGTWSINSNTNSHSASLSDTDGPSGPNLGRCLRRPLMGLNNGKGLAFGRELELCVQDTACEAGVDCSADGIDLEGRSLPALVVRCAQHIVKWGVQEEGLFRISGRSTHVSKLRAEFDSGADYDLRECGPGEIDPHAVSSILKAYLRELPEPLLTRHLMPYFEAALAAENNMNKANDAQASGEGRSGSGIERVRGPGLPSGPRDSVQVRKAPSLSTFAVPALSQRTISATLLNALSVLIARLPKENRDLLRTVTELISATARASRETKMPLSNLLLVFCPSLMMSPPLLRVLCEGKDIWDGPLGDVKIPSLCEEPDSEEETSEKMEEEEDQDEEKAKEGEEERGNEGETGLHSQGTIRRSPRTSDEATREKVESDAAEKETETTPTPPIILPSLVLPPDTSPVLNGRTTAASSHTKTDSSISASVNLSSPDGLLHSPISLNTPPSSNPESPSPSTSIPPPPSTAMAKPGLDTAGLSTKMFALRAQSDLPSPLSPSAAKKAVRKSLIGNPVPFPLGLGMSRSSSGGSAPVTPVELTGSERLSLTSHSSSSPNLGVAGGSSRGSSSAPSPSGSLSPPRLGRRKSKASLLGLASKRSLSSLLGRSQAQPQQQMAEPLPPQITMREVRVDEFGIRGLEIDEPIRRPSTPCPVLELPVDTSSIQLGLGLDLTDEPESLSQSQSQFDGQAHPYSQPQTKNNEAAAPSRPRVPSPSPSPLSSSPHPAAIDRAESSSSAVTTNSNISNTHSEFYYTPPTSARALAPVAHSLSVASSVSEGSSSGSYSFLDFSFGNGGASSVGEGGDGVEDWVGSVLKAAGGS
ncbi:RhoGAP-domain-containing protein [Fomitiporia mediterranea MF3/22]|uniref:RhoGAP-domain-containing protein n=1 Tax=Fomitiporia mediterranea (strain MF3/22) TaxID=694068 RepID=UPI0004408497|nr:RhoGAP-domain-containing protein [Fomitiporia mediterranea MF3/22]EJD03139.1 RhoGAP-domain-containing protein [Fomitiporia mediterranea MF3/22]